MDGQIRLRTLINRLAGREDDAKIVRPKPRDDRPQKMFQHFASEEERQAHLKYVEEAQRNGSVPF